jgi:hypothetical protein
VHGYIVQDWCCIPMLSNVKHVLFESRVDSLILLIMNSLMTQMGLQEEDLTSRLACFGVDVGEYLPRFQIQNYNSNLVAKCSIYTKFHCHWCIGLIWQYKPSHTYLLYLTLKHFCNVCMLISTTTPKNTWSLPN